MPTDLLVLLAVAGWFFATIFCLLFMNEQWGHRLTRRMMKEATGDTARDAIIGAVALRLPDTIMLLVAQIADLRNDLAAVKAELEAAQRGPDLSPDMASPTWVGRCRGCGVVIVTAIGPEGDGAESHLLNATIGRMVAKGLLVDRVSGPVAVGPCRCVAAALEGGEAS